MEGRAFRCRAGFDGVLEDADKMDQPDKVKAMVFWGHAPNSQTRLPDMQKAMEQLELLVVIDPYPDRDGGSVTTARTASICCRPRPSSRPMGPLRRPTVRCSGAKRSSIRCSSRCPITRSCTSCLRRNSALPMRCSRTSRSRMTSRTSRTSTLEFNKGMWTIGYTGQSPERLKKHMANQHTFDRTHAAGQWAVRAMVNITVCHGRAGAPPKWGIRARRTCTIRPSRLAEGGLTFRARFGVEGGRMGRWQPSGRRILVRSGVGNRGRLSGVHHGHADRNSAGTAT